MLVLGISSKNNARKKIHFALILLAFCWLIRLICITDKRGMANIKDRYVDAGSWKWNKHDAYCNHLCNREKIKMLDVQNKWWREVFVFYKSKKLSLNTYFTVKAMLCIIQVWQNILESWSWLFSMEEQVCSNSLISFQAFIMPLLDLWWLSSI